MQVPVEPVYNTHEEIQEFFNSTLSLSKLYQRVSAYFDKRSIIFLSKGIKKLLFNNGRIEFILSTEISDNETIQDIIKGYEEKKRFDEKLDLNDIKDEDILSLKFLIKIGKVEIKIAKTESGIFHDKFGLLHDFHGNLIVFSGSNNETLPALISNYESFETTINWDASSREIKKINHRVQSFKNLWENTMKRVDVWPADHFFEFNFNEKITSEEPIEIPKNFKEKIILLDYEINSKKIIINSNSKNLKKYFDSFDGEIFTSKFDSFYENKIISKQKITVTDILGIYEFLLKQSVKFEDSIILTRTFENLIDAHYLDLEELSIKGHNIKDQEFILSDEFQAFKNEVNSIVKRPLRDAQLQSAYHLIHLRRTMNFSVPGSGKTASVLGAFAYLMSKGQIDKLIVVGPLNCFKSWKDEYEVVIKDSDTYDVYDSRDDTSSDINVILSKDFHKLKVILINYETLPSILDVLKRYVKADSMIVFDEIHRVKRIDGSYSNAVIDLANLIKFRVALTGTPIPNGYLDLFNLFKTLFSDYSSSYFGFDESYLKKVNKKYSKTKIEDADLNHRINPFFIRISKFDLNVPPPNRDTIINIEQDNLTEQFNKIYLNSETNYLLKIAKIVQYSSIAQVLINENSIQEEISGKEPILYDNNFNQSKIISEKMAKTLELTKDLLNKDKSVIIWCVFVKTIDILSDYLSSNNVDNRIIYGKTDTLTRDQNVNDFNNGQFKVLISNPSTLAESVSLHHACHDAIYFELTFNLSHYLQSRDRIHRLGISEDQETNYYILQSYFGGNSLDSKIYNRLKEKERVMKKAIERGDLILEEENNLGELLINAE